jgi:hypothetical protein
VKAPYRDEYAEQAFRLCLLGHDDADLAKAFQIEKYELVEWRLRQPEFADACKRGRLHADAAVAESLYRRATGYDYQEERAFAFQGHVTTAMVEKHIPADIKAAVFWLTNRTKKSSHPWAQTVEHVGDEDAPLLMLKGVKLPEKDGTDA